MRARKKQRSPRDAYEALYHAMRAGPTAIKVIAIKGGYGAIRTRTLSSLHGRWESRYFWAIGAPTVGQRSCFAEWRMAPKLLAKKMREHDRKIGIKIVLAYKTYEDGARKAVWPRSTRGVK